MKWILVVSVLWNTTPVQQYEIEVSSERVCKEAMFALEQKLLEDALRSKHDGYTLTCKPKEDK